MESLGDILKRLGDTRNLPAGEGEADTGVPPLREQRESKRYTFRPSRRRPSSRARSAATADGFTSEVPAGHPDFGKVVTCQCQRDRIADERTARLLRYSNIGHLSRFTFATLDTDGLAGDEESKAQLPGGVQGGGGVLRVGRRLAGLIRADRERQDSPGGGYRESLHREGPDRLLRSRAGPAGPPKGQASVPAARSPTRSSSTRSGTLRRWCLDGLEAQSITPWAHEKLKQIVNHPLQR